MARSKDEIIVDLITNILREEGRADVMPGQVLRDVSINAQAIELENLYNQIDRVALSQSISNANYMTQQELDNLLSNFGIVRRGAQKAIGQVTFYTSSLPSQTVTIPKNTSLGTNLAKTGSREVTFSTRYDVSFDPSVQSTYYNINTGFWEITVDIIADEGGTESNVGGYTITKVRNVNIPFQVTNKFPTTGGVDQESNQDFAVRALNIVLGSNAGTENGYRGLALSQDNVLDVLVVGPGDALMTRDGGYGGKVDLWIVPATAGYDSLSPSSDSSLAYNWDLSAAFNQGYRFDFPKLPLDASVPVSILGTTGPSGSLTNVTLFESRNPAPVGTAYVNPSGTGYHYTVYKADNLDTAGSVYANDYIIWNPDEMEYLRQFNPSGTPFTGNTLSTSISYSYTKVVEDLQNVLDSADNKILTADVLAKEAIQLLVDVTMSIKLFPDFKTTTATEQLTVSNVQAAIIETINNIQLGNVVQESDIIAAAANVEGVDQVVISSVIVTKRRPEYFDTTQEAIIDESALENQYFLADTINVSSI
jgi:hypothetical protein